MTHGNIDRTRESSWSYLESPRPPGTNPPERYARYDVALRFSVDSAVPPPRNAVHGALEAVRTVTVMASSIEQAEAHVDQIRRALEQNADGGEALRIGRRIEVSPRCVQPTAHPNIGR
jgi:hypothetical protein